MKKILDRITEEMKGAFTAAGYDATYGKVTLSNRPDLCEYQCNGAMAAAKAYKKKPIDIANGVVEHLKDSKIFEEVSAVMPGFINLKIGSSFLADYMNGMRTGEKLGMEPAEHPETVIVDYGGANVAKPLHVGHLRAAVIGEAIKRMGRFVGHKVIGDVHLGDWGLQMGLIIEELKERQPELCYFDEGYTGEYPGEPPFTISELEEIYPAASAKSKVDEAFKERAQEATFKLQSGYAPYRAIWNHIMSVSLKDLKKNYSNLNVEFDLWKGESDAQPYIPAMIDDLVEKGLGEPGSPGGGYCRGDRYQGAAALHHPEIRRGCSLCHLRSGHHCGEGAGFPSGPLYLCGGQASGPSFHPGIPGGKEGRDRGAGAENGFRRLRDHERQRRKAL